MVTHRNKKTSFATREQELLLRATLLDGQDALAAWQAWKAMVDLEGHHDNGSYRLFPLLYKNMERNGNKDPFVTRLKGIYRQAWYKNHRLFHDMSIILRHLHDAGIRTMVLKGAALAVLCYENYAVRPMADVDVLVHPSQVLLAIDILEKEGWKPTTELTEDDLLYRHSKQLKDCSGKEFDLHWHLLSDSCWDGADTDFWDGAVSLTIGGVSTLSPNPADMLLHVIVHGVKWNPEPPIRWIADAVSLIKMVKPGIDWMRFMAQAKKHRVVLHVRKALNYLHDTYGILIPSVVLHTINNVRISPMETLEYKYVTRNPEISSDTFLGSLSGAFPEYVMEYRRLHNGAGGVRAIRGLTKYLQYRMKKDNLSDLLSYLIFRSIRITKNKLFSRPRSSGSG